jgi:hypothetical protein
VQRFDFQGQHGGEAAPNMIRKNIKTDKKDNETSNKWRELRINVRMKKDSCRLSITIEETQLQLTFFLLFKVGIRSASTPSVTRRGLGLSSMGQQEYKHAHRCV